MDAARSAVDKITGRGGHHDTNVEEVVNPAITQETVKPTRHEETTQAVDKEVHQDHYHTTVQPLAHREVLPEQHTHQQAPVQERVFHHGDSDKIRSGVQAEAAQFTDSSTTAPTTHTSSQGATALGEHVHHHVHETVQPVIHKETVQPEVVHTTVPIHEKHHAPSEHHGMSTMPVKSLSDFKSSGIPLTGTGHRTEHYEGDPRQYNPTMQVERHDVDVNPKAHDGLHSESHSGGKTAAAAGAAAVGAGVGASSSQHHTSDSRGLTDSNTGALSSTTGTGTGLSQHNTSGSHGLTDSTPSGVTSGNTASSNTGAGVGAAVVGAGAATGPSQHNTSGSHGLTSGTGSDGLSSSRGVETTSSSHGLGSAPAHDDTTTSGTGHTSNILSHGTGTGTGTGTDNLGSSSTTTATSQPRESTTQGHGITNQLHHGSAKDNTTFDDSVQHGTQARDPAMVDNKSDKKLTGTGVDGSHSAVFGLTPDGHKHDDTQHTSTSIKPAHSKDVSNTNSPQQKALADQLDDPRVAEKGHGGQASYDLDSAKPGAGAPGGSQGFGNVRPEEHGTKAKLESKLDPTTDADGDGKRGVLD